MESAVELDVPVEQPAQPDGAVASSSARARRPLAVVGAVLRWVAHALWPLALVLGAWALWVEAGDVPPAVAPAPSGVLTYILDHPGDLARDALSTVAVVGLGMVVGTFAGVLLASLSWFSGLARSVISGPALITQCLPVATISPVLARVLGYGTTTIVVITALISFFPVLVFTTSGLRNSPAGADDVFAAFGAGRWRRFRGLAIPSAVPHILIALRLSVVAAVVGAMLAQWIMGTSGLGYRLVVAQAAFRTTEAWAAAVVAIVLSVLLYAVVAALSRRAQSRFE